MTGNGENRLDGVFKIDASTKHCSIFPMFQHIVFSWKLWWVIFSKQWKHRCSEVSTFANHPVYASNTVFYQKSSFCMFLYWKPNERTKSHSIWCDTKIGLVGLYNNSETPHEANHWKGMLCFERQCAVEIVTPTQWSPQDCITVSKTRRCNHWWINISTKLITNCHPTSLVQFEFNLNSTVLKQLQLVVQNLQEHTESTQKVHRKVHMQEHTERCVCGGAPAALPPMNSFADRACIRRSVHRKTKMCSTPKHWDEIYMTSSWQKIHLQLRDLCRSARLINSAVQRDSLQLKSPQQ